MDLEILKKARDTAHQIQESDIQTYILKNQKKMDAQFLRLIADQWIARQKARYKLPSWYANPDIIYPAPLSVEQSSSEITSRYKARLFSDSIHNKLIDLTGGMGVDTSAFAESHKQVIYIERNETLTPVTEYNLKVLGYHSIEVKNEDAISFLRNNPIGSDIHCYVDPARRDSAKNKVFRIEDCEPDILNIKHLMGDFLIKYSPILDIKLALEQLQSITEVHVVAVENEVKELLFLKQGTSYEPKIVCVNFLPDESQQTFAFNYQQEQALSVHYALPKKYIYEPNAAILKAGAFKSVAQANSLEKLAPSSHLYTSDTLSTNFPGRSFICEAVCKFDKKEILSNLDGNQANISTRNFPMKPDEIKKKLGLKDGGDVYLFATENYHQHKMVLICRKAVV
ncbi:THUMP-like domain-containing protein [Emticicia sp. C21]|uniref:THUMP-like domain-containing protein n=1 Tax=Emticicia sp. C21 TaxID=2302915 RepID=UPI000E35696F|nr:SAM-dependent methyltransferase [Emticicia sp. C21]RFS14504.1 SAM-dependent methyltransferase [Emticicia sp. C21]